MLFTKQFMVPIDFHSIFPILWKSMATVNYLVTNILQNIFFCVQQNKETQIYRFSDKITFGWTIPLSIFYL